MNRGSKIENRGKAKTVARVRETEGKTARAPNESRLPHF